MLRLSRGGRAITFACLPESTLLLVLQSYVLILVVVLEIIALSKMRLFP